MIIIKPIDNLDIVMESITLQCNILLLHLYLISFLYIEYQIILNFHIIINNVSVNKPTPGVISHGVQYLLVSIQQL